MSPYTTDEMKEEREIEKFVHREVVCSISSLLNYLIESHPHPFDTEWYIDLHYKNEDTTNEVLQYYIVTSYLGSLLEKIGQPVTNYFSQPIWGRTTAGQLIACDYCMKVAYRLHRGD
tara:strand:+ start:3702 stop:4052 length:351 start_codon:yes stop_codon:yes gene_type:complete